MNQAAQRPQNGVVLALGGGGVRGAAHLGVLRALREAGVPVAGLAGTSAGALAAAAFAFGLPLEPSIVVEALSDPGLARLEAGGAVGRTRRLLAALRAPALVDGTGLREGLEDLFGGRRLEESPVPLALVAADLSTGEPVALREGPVVEALLASCAVPGVFPPVLLEGRLLVDGGVSEKVPVSAAEGLAGPHPVIAVDVSNPAPEGRRGSPDGETSALGVVLAAGEASRRRLTELSLGRADLAMRLSPARPIGRFDAAAAEEAYRLGERGAREALPRVRELLTASDAAERRRCRGALVGALRLAHAMLPGTTVKGSAGGPPTADPLFESPSGTSRAQ
jgi:NTE family protein